MAISPGSPEALTLAQWISQSYMYHLGADLLSSGSVVGESLLKNLWQHQDAILCCSLKAWSVPEVLRPLYESSKVVA
ncbi:putative class III homeodomain-leucine zipper family [Helianthus annuus]|nr:putative class III homeodomain-leucine zipper family [Helianthus annuus]